MISSPFVIITLATNKPGNKCHRNYKNLKSMLN